LDDAYSYAIKRVPKAEQVTWSCTRGKVLPNSTFRAAQGAVLAITALVHEERAMIIQCLTTNAAGQVLAILLHAHLRPIHEFTITPVLSVIPPITFTLTPTLPPEQLARLGAAVSTVAEARIADDLGE
jgi:hypothetical protein